MDYKRNYRFKSGTRSQESKQFWLMAIIGLAVGAAILYFF